MVPLAYSAAGMYSGQNPLLPKGGPSAVSARKSSHLKPSERFNTYTVNDDYGAAQAGRMAAVTGRNVAKASMVSEGAASPSLLKNAAGLPLTGGRNNQVRA